MALSKCIFSCSKYEEIYPPNVSEFVYITDDTYNQRQVIRMEHLIIKILSFDLSIPTPLTFITATCIINKLSEKTMNLAMVSNCIYLTQIVVHNLQFLHFFPYLNYMLVEQNADPLKWGSPSSNKLQL